MVENEQSFKLRFYWKKGKRKGKTRTEVFFSTVENMADKYIKMCSSEDDALNPTAWALIHDKWQQILDSDMRDIATCSADDLIGQAIITDTNIEDVVDAAIDEGISYWCSVIETVENPCGEDYSAHILNGGVLKLRVADKDERKATWYKLDKDAICRGIQLWLKDFFTKNTIKNVIYRDKSDVIRLDLAMVDSEMSDAIIQYSIFGEMLFA